MVTSTVVEMVTSTVLENVSTGGITLEEYMLNPPDRMELVEGQLVEKNGMTAKHGRTQARLSYYWGNYMISSNQGGEVYTETSCRTVGRGRCPDLAYLTPALVAQFGDFTVLPQSFPLIAEIVSPTDFAEEIIAKSQEYLQSGGEEVWLVFPETRWIIVVTQQARIVFVSGEVVSTQTVLNGFSVAVDELLG